MLPMPLSLALSARTLSGVPYTFISRGGAAASIRIVAVRARTAGVGPAGLVSGGSLGGGLMPSSGWMDERDAE